MARREYQGAATSTTITGGITSSATSLVLTTTTGWPTGSFSAVIDPGQAGEEKILCTSRSGATVTITTRGYDGTTASAHVAGATIYPVPTAIDFDEANAHTTASAAVHGLTGTVVGTTDTQTLTNKSLSDSTTSFVDVADATKVLKIDVTGTTGVTGTLQSAFTTAKTLTLPDATDTLVGKATTDTLTNKTLTSPTINTPVLPLLTTTGDIIYASAASTPARLAAGTSGYVLTSGGAGVAPSWAAASSGAMTQIQQVSVATTQTTISFTAISGSYNHLVIKWNGKGPGASTALMSLRFNADTGANYDMQKIWGQGAGTGASEVFGATIMNIGEIWATTASGVIEIPNYKGTTLNKNAVCTFFAKYGTATGNIRNGVYAGSWRSNSAITQIDLTTDSGDFQAGTVFTLYGIL